MTTPVALARFLRAFPTSIPHIPALPRIRNDSDWEKGLRASARASTGRGWSIREDKGRPRLELRTEQLRGSITLPFDWARNNTGDIIARIRNIYSLVSQGHDLQAAATIASRVAPIEGYCPWEEALESFEKEKRIHGNRIAEKAWNDNYRPYLNFAVKIMSTRKTPASAMELGRQVVERWHDKSRSRQIAVNSLASFLEYCIEVYGLNPAAWTFTQQQKKTLRGKKPMSREKAILTDSELIELLDSLGTRPEAILWQKRLQLMIMYGLRPEELFHLELRPHPTSQKPIGYCTYEKPSGEYLTKPRWLDPCLPLGSNWSEPDLEIGNFGVDAIHKFLGRQSLWTEYKRICTAKGLWLRPYVFRDSYSYRCHQQGRPLNRICLAMGHSLMTHQKHYVWAQESTVLDAITTL